MAHFESVFTKALTCFPDYQSSNYDKSSLDIHVVRTIVLNYIPSISKEDHLTFFQHIIYGTKPQAWKGKTWDVFTESSFPNVDLKYSSGFPSWGQPSRKNSFALLQSSCPELLQNSLESNEWKSWGQREEDCYSNFPASHMSNEERLLLIKILRPDNLNTAIAKYCCDEIGIESLSPSCNTLSQHWRENLEAMPIPVMLITLQESDPGNEVKALAEVIKRRYGIEEHKVMIHSNSF